MTETITLPIKTENPLNGSHGRWFGPAKKRREQRGVVMLALRRFRDRGRPTRVTFVRLSAGEMDGDGLQASCKALRDGVADAFGCDDSKKSGIVWEYAQERCKRGQYWVRIELEWEAANG